MMKDLSGRPDFLPEGSQWVHYTFQASRTRSAAQGGIGLFVPIDAKTVRCRIPRELSIAEYLNPPKSVACIRLEDSESRNCSNAIRSQAAICTRSGAKDLEETTDRDAARFWALPGDIAAAIPGW
jgi:hypothetical protein